MQIIPLPRPKLNSMQDGVDAGGVVSINRSQSQPQPQ